LRRVCRGWWWWFVSGSNTAWYRSSMDNDGYSNVGRNHAEKWMLFNIVQCSSAYWIYKEKWEMREREADNNDDESEWMNANVTHEQHYHNHMTLQHKDSTRTVSWDSCVAFL
jgi:hypothetical protein